jgi:hypothetical protein
MWAPMSSATLPGGTLWRIQAKVEDSYSSP